MNDRGKLQLKLFGPFAATWANKSVIDIRGAKNKALIATLACSPEYSRSRLWICNLLWGRSGPELGRSSLRQALSSLRSSFGNQFDSVFDVSNDTIGLRRDAFMVRGNPSDGAFLEGIHIREEGFELWLRGQRKTLSLDPAQLREYSFFDRILPSIAVLPLVVLGGGTNEIALGDAVAQEITRALSRSHLLAVVSHLSCRNLDLQQVALSDIRKTLDVDYVVHGRLGVAGDRISLDLELAETSGGRICWTRVFNGNVTDFFNGDNELIWTIALQIGKTILRYVVQLATTKPFPDIESHVLLMSGISLMHHQSLRSFSKAREQIQEVIGRAPRHPVPHAWLGKWYILNVQQGWSVDLARDARMASDCTKLALDLNPECPFSLSIDGFVQNHMLKRFDIAERRLDDALSIDPNAAIAWLLKGALLAFVDRGDEAVACTRNARRLSPLDPYSYFFDSLSATACAAAGDYAGALKLAERSLRANRRHTSTLRVRTAALEMLGRHNEARDAAAELMKREPNFTINGYFAKHPAANFATGQEWARALLNAGIPAD